MKDKGKINLEQIIALLTSVETSMDVAIEKSDNIHGEEFGALYTNWTRARYLMEGAKINAKVALEILEVLATVEEI